LPRARRHCTPRIGDAAGREIRIDPERFALEVIDGGAAEVVEIVRQDLGREADRDALGALEQDDGESGRQRDGLPGASIVAELPRGRLGVEEDLAGEWGQAGLDVSRRGRLVARQHVAEIALRFDEEAALGEPHERGADRGVAVRMKAHRGSDDVGHLMEPAVVHLPQGVEHAPLHRLEAIVDVWHGAVKDDVAGVVEEPVAVVLRQRRATSVGQGAFGVLG